MSSWSEVHSESPRGDITIEAWLQDEPSGDLELWAIAACWRTLEVQTSRTV